MPRKKVEPPADPEPPSITLKDFAPINVPIVPLRMELAQLSADGFTTMPLDTFLLIVHRLVKEAKNG
jgi:hypothetical protein